MGHTLPQTVFTCLYLLHPERCTRPHHLPWLTRARAVLLRQPTQLRVEGCKPPAAAVQGRGEQGLGHPPLHCNV